MLLLGIFRHPLPQFVLLAALAWSCPRLADSFSLPVCSLPPLSVSSYPTPVIPYVLAVLSFLHMVSDMEGTYLQGLISHLSPNHHDDTTLTLAVVLLQ